MIANDIRRQSATLAVWPHGAGQWHLTRHFQVSIQSGMTTFKWRPNQQVSVKVIGICVSAGRLLAAEIYDDKGRMKGVRPLGGVVEFGESREQALKREFQEELNTEIRLNGPWLAFENIYTHERQLGHEYVFGIGIELLDRTVYGQEITVFSEDSGSMHKAAWFEITALKQSVIELYPDGLKEAL